MRELLVFSIFYWTVLCWGLWSRDNPCVEADSPHLQMFHAKGFCCYHPRFRRSWTLSFRVLAVGLCALGDAALLSLLLNGG